VSLCVFGGVFVDIFFYLGSLGADCWSDTAAWMTATDLDLKGWGAYCNFCLQDDLHKGHGLSHIEIRHLVSLKFQICDIHMLEGHNPPQRFSFQQMSLSFPAASAKLPRMKALCEARASADSPQNEGWAPIHIASRHGHAP